jgi:RNA polymerase sigma-70 factor (ECF subfamily)
MVGTLTLDALNLWPAWAEKEAGLEPGRASDAALVRAAAQGEPDAFRKLVESHQRAVYGLCLRLLRDQDEASDAAQEAFVRAYAALATFDTAQAFAPWVLRIARNHCLDLLRRRVPADRLVELDAPRGEGEGRTPELEDEKAIRSDEALANAERSQVLEAAVAALPERYREVINLFHVQQLSYQQIATVMNVPIGTVMTWLHRARAALRKQLAGREEVQG